MSKESKGKDTKSIINVRAFCDICKKTDTFDIPIKELLPHIGGLYQISTIHHCKEEKVMVMNIVVDRNYTVRQTSISPFVAEREIDRWSPEKVSDIKFLVKQVKESDKAILGVLSGKTVIVAGTNATFVKRLVQILGLFSPTKYPQTEEWTDKVIKNKKIIGTSPEVAVQYEHVIIINIDTNKVLNSKPSPYCKMLLDYLITLEPEGMAYAAKLKIGMLIEFAKMLIDLSKEPKIGEKALELVKMDVSADALQLILDIVDGFDPTAMEILRHNWL